jgi:hypothetical protein
MSKPKPMPASPPVVSGRVVPESLGKGRVNLYDARVALPALVPDPPAGLFDNMRWVVVHLPSRHWFAHKTRPAALSMLNDVSAGKATHDVKNLLPKEKNPPAHDRAHTKKKPVKKVSAPEEPPKQEEEKKAPDKPSGPTPVPEGMDFDKAMKLVFPVQRITANLEELLTASTQVFNKDGDAIGEQPAHQTRLQALKTLIEYHVGKAIEKEKTKEVKAPLTLQELRAKMVLSDEYRAGILEMAADCAKEAEARKTGGKPG